MHDYLLYLYELVILISLVIFLKLELASSHKYVQYSRDELVGNE